jgi:serine/threonine protein kinase
MAPEQVLGRPLTPQADVYAFAILLFELLTGAKPIQGESVERIFQVILYEPLNLDPLKALNPPTGFVQLIERCTAKQPTHRPAGLAAVCDEIERIVNPSKVDPSKRARVPSKPPSGIRPPAAAAPVSAENLPQFFQQMPPWLRSQTGLMLMAGAAAVVLMTVLYAILRLLHVL